VTKYDVAIVGAGPSGSTTAYHLSKAGARVLLIDKAKYPRVKPCGGGVTARCYEQAPVDLTPVVERVIDTVRLLAEPRAYAPCHCEAIAAARPKQSLTPRL
jgi:flavin-dependent dehydrogenase